MSVLKPFLIFIIILSNLGSTLMVPLIYLDFEVRKGYISKVLCIKKDDPITVCGGSCYLAKQLNKAQDHQQEAEKTSPREFAFFLNVLKYSGLASKQWMLRQNLNFISYSDQLPKSLFCFDIFHPPRLG
ncbi:hypothetical protein QQ020_13845 [Fulvivirgaceae bacterium BMA12]|uniref:Uncharacterized protein n=1 Tax=Agaribacillus aureus TaxID=3051825 RepID=A0ABT8L5X2_9BACT|nr:hypothetical protein [Fulvivirgaceae bacterium BMA12]